MLSQNCFLISFYFFSSSTLFDLTVVWVYEQVPLFLLWLCEVGCSGTSGCEQEGIQDITFQLDTCINREVIRVFKIFWLQQYMNF